MIRPEDASGSGPTDPLTRAHDELRTALTIIRTNAALARIAMREGKASALTSAHLGEIDDAVVRLETLSRGLRRWRPGARDPPGEGGAQVTSRAKAFAR